MQLCALSVMGEKPKKHLLFMVARGFPKKHLVRKRKFVTFSWMKQGNRKVSVRNRNVLNQQPPFILPSILKSKFIVMTGWDDPLEICSRDTVSACQCLAITISGYDGFNVLCTD